MTGSRNTAPDPKLSRVEAAARAETIKAELRREIHGRRLSQRDLSRDLGYGDSYLANLFMSYQDREPVQLRLDTLLALVNLLGLDPGAFINRALSRHGAIAAPAGTTGGARVNGYAGTVGLIRELAEHADAIDDIPQELIQQAVDDALTLVSRLTRRMGKGSGKKEDRGSEP